MALPRYSTPNAQQLHKTALNNNAGIGRITTAGVVTIYTDPSIRLVNSNGITAGPDGALWFTNLGNSIGRITTAGVVTNYTDPSISGPYGIAAGPDGALWFTNSYNNSIGRITTAGVVTNYTDPTINMPFGISTGPDGALWFTNTGNSTIGRISTAGVVTSYTDPSISGPFGITAGPDSAMWFINNGNNSIGRVSVAVNDTDLALAGVPITCTASSADDTPATVSQSFMVTVNGAATQISTIANQVANLSSPPIVKNTLLGLLQTAQNAISRGDTRAACIDLTAFRVAVQVLERVPPPFGIPPGQGAPLIAEAQQVRATLGC